MRIISTVFITFIIFTSMIAKDSKTIEIKLIETTDVHGMFFPKNYMTGKPAEGTLARVSSYVKRQRGKYGDNLILLENGDLLQGQPTNYYWNFIQTKDENIAASVINYMGYDAQNLGNHDVETGHDVYEKWIKEVRCPVLGANIIDDISGKPWAAPYIVLEREGIRIGIIGMITPAIPHWLSHDIWEGLRFEDMVSSARRWVEEMRREANPDVIVGLFHSGLEGGITTAEYSENAVGEIARNVTGFDVIFYGHDHRVYCGEVKNVLGERVYLVNAGNNAKRVGEAVLRITTTDGRVTGKSVTTAVPSMEGEAIDADFKAAFRQRTDSLEVFVSRRIGDFDTTVYTRDALFGSSAFVDLVHNLQLSITGADISFSAPMMLNAVIHEGPVTMADMFNLYKYENKLYVVRMRGEEIKRYLEKSYALWTRQMKTTEDHILLFDESDSSRRISLQNPFFNFDSAAGIDYTVDVTKPEGEKVRIIQMSDGRPFSADSFYMVAMNSYRANGGGELITLGAGLTKSEMESRIVFRSELDLRYYFMKEIERLGRVSPRANGNWHFVPDEFAVPAIIRDKRLLFPEK